MLKSLTMRRMGRPLGRLSPRPLLWRAGVGRTLAETLLLASCLLTLAWAHSVAVPAVGRDWTLRLFTPAGASLCAWLAALRLRLPAEAWWSRAGRRQSLLEILACGAVAALGALPWPLAPGDPLAEAALPLLSFVAQAGLATLLLRLWMYLGRSWDRFRRQRLRWALAHALLLVVVAATLAWVAVSSIRNATGSYEFVFHIGSMTAPAPPPESGAARVIIRSDEVAADLSPPPLALRLLNTFDQKMTSMLLSGSVLLLAIMPPFALFSWAVARRVTGRLESLVAAAGALGSGDYAARVAVSGEDELAQLQAHFNAMAGRLQRAMDELEGERQKSEQLLLNILPRNVVDRLKDQPGLIADDYPEVTVLFADIVDFTQRAARLAPEAMLAWLNQIFSTFDQLAEAHGLEKIKTIGDAYMVVGGAPTRRPDHASAVAELALAMQRAVGEMTDPHGQPLRMRIGVNTGEVIAGVIGTRKFIYDLWGDAVNTASRMESQGVEGGIQVTEATYRLLRGSYRFAKRGTLQIKGKGAMTTYLLLGPRAEPRGAA